MSRRPKRLDPVALGAALPRVLGELGLDGAVRGLEVARRWEEIVGEPLARFSEPAGIRGAVLEVNVASSAWSQQLQLRGEEILAALREALGEEAPTRLRLRVAPDRLS